MVAAEVGSTDTDTVSIIFVNSPAGLSEADRKKLTDYMEVRLSQKKINLIVNPTNFPWPSRKDRK